MAITCLINAIPECMERCRGKDRDGECILYRENPEIWDKVDKNGNNDKQSDSGTSGQHRLTEPRQ